jgi:integrase
MMVQLLTGMGYNDMKCLQFHNISFDENHNKHFIHKDRNKTDVPFKVPLTENGYYMMNKLIELTGDEKKPFNLPSIDFMNRSYKKMGEKLGIKTKITTYTFRHTFSVNFIENGGKIQVLSLILGHTLLKSTQVYGKISNKTLSVQMDEVENKSKIHQLQTK